MSDFRIVSSSKDFSSNILVEVRKIATIATCSFDLTVLIALFKKSLQTYECSESIEYLLKCDGKINLY